MSASRRTRLSVLAAALSAALVVTMAGTALAAEDLDCSDFDHQEEAQAVLDADRSDPHRLDGGADGAADGVACESLPRRGVAGEKDDDEEETAPATTPATAPAPADDEDEDTGDRDCADFATLADAQAALAGSPGDRERLDSDDDGIACERHFGTEGRQVAVFPQGGVATGGAPLP